MNKLIYAVLILMLSNTPLMAFEKGEPINVNGIIVCTDASYMREALDRHEKEGVKAAIDVLNGGRALGVCELVEVGPEVKAMGFYQETLEERVIEGNRVALVMLKDMNGVEYYTVLYVR